MFSFEKLKVGCTAAIAARRAKNPFSSGKVSGLSPDEGGGSCDKDSINDFARLPDIACSAQAAQKIPATPPTQAKCPVCGMFVAKYPGWVASITFRDSTSVYFDGPKDLFRFYLNPGKYIPARKQADFAGIYVKDYYSLAVIDGRRAFYVIGSNVMGPMGKELVPFARKDDAEGFMHDHQGGKILSFSEITWSVLKVLE
jgi:nitrous oxide reductase accessory protein NosL